MDTNLKALCAAARPKETRELVETHVKRVALQPERRQATLQVDKQYAFNQLTSQSHFEHIKRSVKNAFGEDWAPVVEVISPASSEREKAVPHTVRR